MNNMESFSRRIVVSPDVYVKSQKFTMTLQLMGFVDFFLHPLCCVVLFWLCVPIIVSAVPCCLFSFFSCFVGEQRDHTHSSEFLITAPPNAHRSNCYYTDYYSNIQLWSKAITWFQNSQNLWHWTTVLVPCFLLLFCKLYCSDIIIVGCNTKAAFQSKFYCIQ